MRVIPNSEIKEQPKEEPKEEPKKEENKIDSFNKLMVQEFGLEVYGMHFFGSLGIHKKSCGLCDMAKFFWEMAMKTQDIKIKIKKFLINAEVDFTYPQIDAVELNKEESVFKQALDYENNRIKHLYEVMDKAPCDYTKNLIGKLIHKHTDIQHLLSLANKISELSTDPLLIQKSVYKLICHE